MLAIADHDSVAGVAEALASAEGTALTVVPALELSAFADGHDVHMLGYFVDHEDPILLERLADMRTARLRRAEAMVSALREAGHDVTLDAVLELSDGGAVGRSHVARALVDAGHADDIRDAFERLIGRGRPFYVGKDTRGPAEAIEVIRSAGGLAVVAHPGVSRLDPLLPMMLEAGLGGIEAYHADHSPEQREHYATYARATGDWSLAALTTTGRRRRTRISAPSRSLSPLWKRSWPGAPSTTPERETGRRLGGMPRATLAAAMRTYLIRTFGCQMNKHDSERVEGLLQAQSMTAVEEASDADVIVFMTCCVRENADERLRGQVASLKVLKPGKGRGPLIAVGGCIGQRDGARLLQHLPHVDVVFGTHNVGHLPALLEAAASQRQAQVEVLDGTTDFTSDLPAAREHPWHAWVPITVGCDNYCSYCIVPYVRGRERSRPMEDVVSEVTRLVKSASARSPCWARTSTPTAATSTESPASPRSSGRWRTPASIECDSPRVIPKTCQRPPSQRWPKSPRSCPISTSRCSRARTMCWLG